MDIYKQTGEDGRERHLLIKIFFFFFFFFLNLEEIMIFKKKTLMFLIKKINIRGAILMHKTNM